MGERLKKEQADQLVDRILEKRWGDTACVLDCCMKLEAYAKENEDIWYLGFALYHRGGVFYIQNEVEQMLASITSAIPLLEQSKQWELEARSYNLMAITSVTKGNKSIAMDYYLSGLNICRKHGIHNVERSITLNLGSLYLGNEIYEEARVYFLRAMEAYEASEKEAKNPAGLTMIYTNLVICYMKMGELDGARQYAERLKTECEPYLEEKDQVYVNCMRARFYEWIGDEKTRDRYIDDVLGRIFKKILVLDVFDDLYDFCIMLFEIRRLEEIWKIIELTGPIVAETGIANLNRKLLSLKMRYYKAKHMEEEFKESAVSFYEQTEILEKDSRSMIASMLRVRGALEQENETNRKHMQEENEKLQRRAETDPMTGLTNRYSLTDYSEKILEACKRENAPLAYEILDIDYFKEYNDNYGHQAGDLCIQKVAKLLREMQREHIFCARYGGDEFIIIYSHMGAEEVYAHARKLREDVMALQLAHAYSKAAAYVTVSQGICFNLPEPGNKSWDYLHAADMLLYHIKKESRNDVMIGDLYEKPLELLHMEFDKM